MCPQLNHQCVSTSVHENLYTPGWGPSWENVHTHLQYNINSSTRLPYEATLKILMVYHTVSHPTLPWWAELDDANISGMWCDRSTLPGTPSDHYNHLFQLKKLTIHWVVQPGIKHPLLPSCPVWQGGWYPAQLALLSLPLTQARGWNCDTYPSNGPSMGNWNFHKWWNERTKRLRTLVNWRWNRWNIARVLRVSLEPAAITGFFSGSGDVTFQQRVSF